MKETRPFSAIAFCRQWWISLVLLFTVLSLSACTAVKTTSSGTVGLERQQYMMVSAQAVTEQALKSYMTDMKGYQTKGKLNTDVTQISRLRRIMNRIVPQVGIFRPDAQSWKWEVNLIESDLINAYCMPGGKIAFYTGILRKLKLTDDEIAAVMGHEIAHALREHSREKLSQTYAQQLVLGGIALASPKAREGNTMKVLQTLGVVGFQLPNSRQMESEADIIGLELMARAGYNPEFAVSLWKKMASQEKTPSIPLLSTHPTDQARIQTISSYLPKVMPLYQQAIITRKY